MCVGAPGEARKCAVCKNERFCFNYSHNEPKVDLKLWGSTLYVTCDGGREISRERLRVVRVNGTVARLHSAPVRPSRSLAQL